MESELTAYCASYQKAIEIVGRRWTGAILRALLTGSTRFGEIAAAIPGVSDRLLSERLKELETEGLVERSVVPSTPVRVDYTLTAKGASLETVVRSVAAWADEWLVPEARPAARRRRVRQR